MQTEKLAAWLNDWWHFTIALVTGAAGLWLGAERTKWRMQQLIAEVEKHDLRLKNIEERARENEKLAAKMEANQQAILAALNDLRSEMHGKVNR